MVLLGYIRVSFFVHNRFVDVPKPADWSVLALEHPVQPCLPLADDFALLMPPSGSDMGVEWLIMGQGRWTCMFVFVVCR